MAKQTDLTPLQASLDTTKRIDEQEAWATAASRMHLEQLIGKNFKDKNPLEYQNLLNFVAGLLVQNHFLREHSKIYVNLNA